jgi:hypothetical protein
VNMLNILQKTARNGFAERLMRSLDDIEYRRVLTTEDLEPVIKLRQKAYRAHNVYVRAHQPMTDDQDLDPRYFTFAVYWQEQLVSTLRIHIVNSDNPVCNSRDYYPDFLDPLISQGLSFMDPTRFAIDPDSGKYLKSLPLFTLRLGFLAAKHFDTDYCLSMIKEQHMAFYREVFKSTQMTPFLPFDAVHARYALFSSPKSMEESICQNYPIFRSTETERNLLFRALPKGIPQVLNVRPSASLTLKPPVMFEDSLSVAS